jgi:predicted transposase YdaD
MVRSEKRERWEVGVGDNSMKVLYVYNYLGDKEKNSEIMKKYFGHQKSNIKERKEGRKEGREGGREGGRKEGRRRKRQNKG